MLKLSLKILLVLSALSTTLTAQVNRTETMGGLKFSVTDRDLSLTPYDFGNNPAWLCVDEKETFLRITPEYGNSWGNYNRKFDPVGEMNLGASFHGVKKLGELGTFSGFTSYNYENRRDYNRTLMKDTYSGQAFNITDTTKSNFRYAGPKVVLMYSWQPITNLYAGGFVSYKLLDGLKEKFSYAKTIYRDTELGAGLAYDFSDNFIIGTNLAYFDSQESIEASDVNLFEVELFYFRGDKYFVSKRGSSITGKIRRQGFNYGTQLNWHNGEKFSAGVQINYSPSVSKLLRPTTVSGEVFSEVEDSYADFKSMDIQIKSQYRFSDDLLLGGYAAYFNNKSWSKISSKELLTWEWQNKKVIVGGGASYQLNDELLIAAEYEFSNTNADSTKHIDKTANEINTSDHELRIGSEYKIFENTLVRTGIKFGLREYDLVYGGKDCSYYRVSGGFSFPLFDSITLDTNVYYSRVRTEGNNLYKNYLSASFGLTLKTF
jgi:opacity protein-like surface antigen